MKPRWQVLILSVLMLAFPALAQDDLFPDEPETFELEPGDRKAFTYIAEVDGEASIWSRAATLDVTLEVLDGSGKRLAFDDDSGGGKASHLYLSVKNEVEYSVVVAAKAVAGDAATVTVALIEAPVTDATTTLKKKVEAVVATMEGLLPDGKYEEARATGATVLAEIRTSADASSTWLEALRSLATACSNAQSLATSSELWKRVLEVHERTLPSDHSHLQATRHNYARTLRSLGDLAGAKALCERALAVSERTLPSDHPDLQRVRMNLASTLSALGDLAGAKALEVRVLAIFERTLPSDHRDLQIIRMNHANTLFALGDLAGAKAYYERALAVLERTLPSDHPDLQLIRMNYASTLFTSGDVARAKALYERVLAVYERTLPSDHHELQAARMNHANTLSSLGELARARALYERVLAVRERTLPSDDLDLQATRMNHASTLFALGDLSGSKTLLERVLAGLERTLPSEHPDLQLARMSYANTLSALGDLAEAKAHYERVLAVMERTLPSDHPDLQTTRMNYASMLRRLGDLAGAKALHERVLAVRERTLPPDHPDVQGIRMNYATTLYSLGDLAGAKALHERVLAVFERTLPSDHPDLQTTRMSYATVLFSLGDLEGAKTNFERVLAVFARTKPVDDPELQATRVNHATTLRSLGDLAGSRILFEQVLAVFERTLPPDHPDLLATRMNFANTLLALVHDGDSDASVQLRAHLQSILDETIESCENSIMWLSSRQVAESAVRLGTVIAGSLSFDDPATGSPDRSAFRLAEQLRALASRARRLPRLRSADGGEVEGVGKLRADLAMRRKSVEDFLSNPALDEDALEDETITSRLAELVRAKETAERVLGRALRKHPAAAELLRTVTVEEIAGALPSNSAAVSFSSYFRRRIEENDEGGADWVVENHLVALILGRTGRVTRCDLGPSETVSKFIAQRRAMIEHDREDLAAERGREIRRLVLDPVLAVLEEGVTRLVVTLADDLHLLGLDSLPLEGGGYVGDEFEIHVVNGLEWLVRKPFGDLNETGFAGFGAADFLGEPKPLEDAEVARVDARGLPKWNDDFRELPFTRSELQTIGMTFERAFGDDERVAAPKIFMGREADKRRLRLHAPKARYLHLATHGWFAPESVPSILDAREFKSLANTMITDLRAEVRGYEPLALCGLALAGANLQPRADGTHPGLLNGNEIADLDLSGVELAVLSACETNVGVRRAGQGIMSLQEALFSAGVRYSITSLWKVPDEATMELMTRFYDGIWRRGETKRCALWNAKLELRNAKDPRTGEPKYGLQDWAGWVLFGNPE